MAQLTIRLDDRLADDVRQHADQIGRSVNAWVVAVLQAAVDPEFDATGMERTRSRLRRAGLLAEPRRHGRRSRPSEAEIAKARAAAGRGTPLSEIVIGDR